MHPCHKLVIDIKMFKKFFLPFFKVAVPKAQCGGNDWFCLFIYQISR